MPRIVILRATNVAPEPRAEKTARWLHRLGHDVRIVAWDRSGELPRLQSLPACTVERIAIPAAFGAGLRTLVPLARWQLALASWLARHRDAYDCVHACDLDTAVVGYVAARLFGKRFVYDIYDWYTDSRFLPGPVRRAVSALDRAIVRRADGVIIVDESRRPQLGGARPRRLAVVYNVPEESADLLAGRAAPAGASEPPAPRLRLAFVGLLSVQRGLREAITVVARHPDWHLDVAGYGAEEAEIRASIAALPNATFHGQVDYARALALSAEADALFATYDPTLPNHRYSSANKLFEAMMLGKPIVVARGTGMDATVEAHGLGFVVPYGDEAAFEAALATVAGWSEAERAAAAARGRRAYVEHFSAERMCDRTRALYAEVLGPTGATPALAAGGAR